MPGLRRSESSALRITEIFLSLQGEGRFVGLPTVFVRLTGCPLRCLYCDTAYAFTGGERMSLTQVVERIAAFGVRHVCVTGGEPLTQRTCPELLTSLCDVGHTVSLETSGAMDVSEVDERVTKVVDLKTPGSGEAASNRYENLAHLRPSDQLKFVICDAADYRWSKDQIERWGLIERCELLFSPSYGELAAVDLADWIVRDRLPVRFQIQLHKLLWGDKPGR